MKQVTAELEFLEEFRRETAAVLNAGPRSAADSEEPPPPIPPKR
jgi:hypothetical protein